METAKTHLGTPELHKRHKIMIEGGAFPRSKVMNQHVFDEYLMYGLINLHQHRAAEFVLSLASKSGVWVRGAQLDNTRINGPSKAHIPFGMMPFGNVLRRLREEQSPEHATITRVVIVHNFDVRKRGMELFKSSMDFVANNIMFFHKNPLRHLE